MIRAFDAPSPNWNSGHRGVDLAGSPGQPVYAAGAATVVYAGTLAGRELVSLAHPGGLHTSYEPVRAAVRPGQSVTAGTAIGELLAGHPGCPVAAFRRGAMAEVIEDGVSGRLAEPDDIDGLARAISECLLLDRAAVGASAIRRLGLEAALDRYESALARAAE